jgi:hypothetical protein
MGGAGSTGLCTAAIVRRMGGIQVEDGHGLVGDPRGAPASTLFDKEVRPATKLT